MEAAVRRTITPALLRRYGACWSDERIADYFQRAGETELSWRAIVEDIEISNEDAIWIGLTLIAEAGASPTRYFSTMIARPRGGKLVPNMFRAYLANVVEQVIGAAS